MARRERSSEDNRANPKETLAGPFKYFAVLISLLEDATGRHDAPDVPPDLADFRAILVDDIVQRDDSRVVLEGLIVRPAGGAGMLAVDQREIPARGAQNFAPGSGCAGADAIVEGAKFLPVASKDWTFLDINRAGVDRVPARGVGAVLPSSVGCVIRLPRQADRSG